MRAGGGEGKRGSGRGREGGGEGERAGCHFVGHGDDVYVQRARV